MGEGHKGGKKGKSCQGTCTKDPGTKRRVGDRLNVGDGVGRAGESNGRKFGQLYLNNNKKREGGKKIFNLLLLVAIWGNTSLRPS